MNLDDFINEHNKSMTFSEKYFLQTVLCKVIDENNLKYITPQKEFIDSEGRHRRIDFAIEIEDNKYAIEVDGYTYHAGPKVTPEKHNDDLKRQNDLINAGYKVLRFSWYAIKNDPAKCIQQLRQTFLSDNGLNHEPVKHEFFCEYCYEEIGRDNQKYCSSCGEGINDELLDKINQAKLEISELKANEIQELTTLGNKLLEKGWIKDAIKAYEKAGKDITENKQGLIECGRKLLEKGWLDEAILAYEKAGKDITEQGLITLGNKLLEKGWIDSAIMAYEKTGKKELITLGNKLLEKRRIDSAIETYEKAGNKQGLTECGNRLLEKGWIKDAILAYEKAENKQRLIECGNRLLKNGLEYDAITAYEKAGKEMPKKLRKIIKRAYHV